MHGSSSVPQELQDIINQYGGKLKPTWGVPVEEIQRGIKHGVRKINVDTDNRLAMTGAIRKVLTEKPEEFDPRGYMKPAREAMKKVVGSHDPVRPGRPREGLRCRSRWRDGSAVQGTAGYCLASQDQRQRPDALMRIRPLASSMYHYGLQPAKLQIHLQAFDGPCHSLCPQPCIG